jgi:hypothetical protein
LRTTQTESPVRRRNRRREFQEVHNIHKRYFKVFVEHGLYIAFHEYIEDVAFTFVQHDFHGLVLFLTENILDIIDGFQRKRLAFFSYELNHSLGFLFEHGHVRRIHGLDIQPGIAKRNIYAVREKFHVLKRKLKYVCL